MRRRVVFALVRMAAAGASAGCTSSGATPTDAAPPDATPYIDANILASNYDRSCTVHADCRPIAEGNACVPCALTCPNAAVNAGALAQWTSDVANKRAALCKFNVEQCISSCGMVVGPCCVNGVCEEDIPCIVALNPAVDAGAMDASELEGLDASAE